MAARRPWHVSFPLCPLGGFGLRSAQRMAPAAYWASWADCLAMLSKRLPDVSAHIMENLVNGAGDDGCLAELHTASRCLDRAGFVNRPAWTSFGTVCVLLSPLSGEPGEWQHGWQYHASSPVEHHHRETVIFAESDAADQAHMRSHAGLGAGSVLCGAPTATEFRVEPHFFRTLVLKRLRLPLLVTEARCECGHNLDVFGRHRAARPRSGRLRARAVGPERSLARVCREAGQFGRIRSSAI